MLKSKIISRSQHNNCISKPMQRTFLSFFFPMLGKRRTNAGIKKTTSEVRWPILRTGVRENYITEQILSKCEYKLTLNTDYRIFH